MTGVLQWYAITLHLTETDVKTGKQETEPIPNQNRKTCWFGKTRKQDFQSAPHDSWREFMHDYVEWTRSYVKHEKFRSIVEKASEVIDIKEMPDNPESRILHMDYTPDNIIIDSELEARVIDFDNAYYGDPLFDLIYAELAMNKRGKEVAETFRAGYRNVRYPSLTEKLERNYRAMAIMQDARAGEWCLRKRKT